MASPSELRDRLRRDIGADSTSLPDAEADALFAEAGELYSDPASAAAYSRVLALQGILASSAKMVTYQQNQSSENASDVFAHLKELLKLWRDNCGVAQAMTGGGAVRSGSTAVKPARIKEYPDG